MTPFQLQRADLVALLRLARYLGVPPLRRRRREPDRAFRDRLAIAIHRYRRLTG